jgi:ketosteroid isomerase-like protein
MSTRERVLDLIDYVKAGRIVDAIQEFYGDGVTMQENREPPTVGKAANLVRERAFAESIAQPHEVTARRVVVDGDQAFIEWVFDFTGRDGQRIRIEEIAEQTWRDGRIEQERFFFDSASVLEGSGGTGA